MTAEPDINKLLPHAADAEAGLLASLLIAPATVGPICAERAIGKGHFHNAGRGLIFGELMAAWTNGKPHDSTTLIERMRDLNALEKCGGPFFIADLITFPTVHMADQYAEICDDKRILRDMWAICNQFGDRAIKTKPEPRALLEELQQALLGVASVQATTKPKTPKEIVMEAAERAEERIAKRGLPDFTMRTGLKKLDDTMSGIRPADFVLVSGKEKSGKSSLAFNIFEHVVFEQKKRAIAFSLEMKLPEIVDRMISAMGAVNLTNILNGWMSDEDHQKAYKAMALISEGKFQIRDDLYSLPQIVGALRQYKSANPDAELAVVDYLQLIDAEKADKEKNREQIIAHTSRTLRRLAGELNIAIILLVQLNEDGNVRESRAPGMDCTAHIRIEPSDEEGMKWARVVYQRNGPSNVGIPLTHQGEYVRFLASAREPAAAKPEKRKFHKD